MITNVVNASALGMYGRLDAEYYKPWYDAFLDAIDNADAVSLEEIAEPVTRRATLRPGEAFEYLEISAIDTTTGYFETQTLDGANAPSRATQKVEAGELLISMVRPARNGVALINRASRGLVGSSGFAVVRPTGLAPEYLFAYLKSSHIARLLDRYTTATMYPAVALADVMRLPVLRPTATMEKKVVAAVQTAQRQLARARREYLGAQRRVLTAGNWDALRLPSPLAWNVRSASTMSRRLDAEHFHPKFAALDKHFKALKDVRRLSDIAPEVRRGVQPRYVEGGDVAVINSRHVGRMFVHLDQAEASDRDFYEDNARARVVAGDVVMNSTGRGTMGRCNVIAHSRPTVVDNHVTIIRADAAECDPYYLSVYLNSIPGALQVERWLSGSSGQTELYPEDIRRFGVHVPEERIQRAVRRGLVAAIKARDDAATAMREATRAIEALLDRATRRA